MSNTDTRTLAAKHADSMLKTIRERVEAGAPFGYVSDSGEWRDIDDAPGCVNGECADDGASEHECEADDWSEASAMDYLSDALDIHYVVNSDRTYRSARVLISYGGPNVWIDTRTRELEVHWDRSEVRALPSEFVNQIDDAIVELWEMGA